jgi:hypothetical protein
MKLLVRLVVIAMAAAVMAAPLERLQKSMREKHEHSLSEAYPRPLDFKTPFVVKAPHQEAPPSPAARKPLRIPQTPASTSWLDRWRRPTTEKSSSSSGNAELSCFCAGGSVCCNTARGMSCNYGICGI